MFPFLNPVKPAKCPLDLERNDDSVDGGEVLSFSCLSAYELSVSDDWFAGGSSLPASLLEVLPDELAVSVVLKDVLERRRMLRSLRNEGIAGSGDDWVRAEVVGRPLRFEVKFGDTGPCSPAMDTASNQWISKVSAPSGLAA